MAEPSPSTELRRLVNGYQVSQAIHVVAALGIADRLKDGPRSSEELAKATNSHPESLYRVLRALAAVGIFQESNDQRFSLTAMGDCLRLEAPDSLGSWAAFIGRPYYWQAWSHLLHSVKTGENAFSHLHGVDVWGYRAANPEEGAIFDAAMTETSAAVARAVLSTYDFSSFERVVDVGGGQGGILSAILKAHSKLSGVLFDQPHVVAGAEPVLRVAGIRDRCELIGGDFFAAVPQDGDAYILKAILHDWEDPASIAILQNCRRAIKVQGKLLVLEQLILAPNEAPQAKFSDLNMLVAPGGQERTREEFASLFAAAGFRLLNVIPNQTGFHVIEGVVAD